MGSGVRALNRGYSSKDNLWKEAEAGAYGAVRAELLVVPIIVLLSMVL
jgi:hypothetical protein